MNIAHILGAKADFAPAKPAVIFKSQSVTFLELKDISFRLAGGLIGLNVKKGDKVAIYLPNCPEYIYSYLAVWCCGATAVPLDFMLTEDELSTCLLHAGAKLLIAQPKATISFERLKRGLPCLKEIVVCCRENSDFRLTQGLQSFAELCKKGKAVTPDTEIEERDYAIIFYTSGTTGEPKGVLVNYKQLDAPCKGMRYFVGEDFSERDITLCALPFSHLGGLIYIQVNILFGITIVLMERFIPLEFLKNIQEHKVGWFWLVPSMYYALLQLKEFGAFDLSSLRWIVTFGAASSADALRRFHTFCPQAYILNGWGLTETNAPTTVISRGSPKIESVGKPPPWIELKILDENAQEVPAGQIGEIAVKGWAVTDGYYRNPEATASAIRQGWFYTGDLGKVDADSDLYIVGRKKEMIKVGGEIVFEPEIESVLHKHPAVAEAAVVGVADNLRGEVPKAFVVLKESESLTAQDLRYFSRQHLAHFKVPHYFELVGSLPKNRAGKIDKELLRKL